MWNREGKEMMIYQKIFGCFYEYLLLKVGMHVLDNFFPNFPSLDRPFLVNFSLISLAVLEESWNKQTHNQTDRHPKNEKI